MFFANAMILAVLTFAPTSQQYPGFEWNKKSILRTDQPVEFPGIVLDAGVYVVRLKENGDRRSYVEVANQDETQVLASFVAVPDHRLRPEDNSEFTFHEVKAGEPRVVHSWFYTGDLVGLEFVYPKPRAKVIAKESDGAVMASNSKDASIVALTPNGTEVMIDNPTVQTARRKAQ